MRVEGIDPRAAAYPYARHDVPAFTAPEPAEAPVSPWVPGFIVFQLLCQMALLVEDIGPLRMFVRMASFGASLGLLLFLRGDHGRRHPATGAALLIMLILGVEIFHPQTISLVAGSAQAGLYIAVLAPLLWVPRTRTDLRVLRRAVLILWTFHTVSAAVGVLQVYFPGQFQPPISTIILAKGKGYLDSLMITTVTGVRVFRPMGLTDAPGGASISGLYAVLIGTGFFLTRRTPLVLAASAASMATGMVVLYLSQVRAVLIMTGIAVCVVAGVLAWRRDAARLATLAATVTVVALTGWVAAMSLAGPSVARRMATLVQQRPGAVYYDSRGRFFEEAVTKMLPESPIGSGLGRWGMIYSYFGGGAENSVWVEIQWAGWIIDGGLPLVLAYLAALAIALWTAWKIARAPRIPGAADLPFWGAIVLAQGVGALALTFSFPIFLSQPGMEFWLLNAALFTAARHARENAMTDATRSATTSPAPGYAS